MVRRDGSSRGGTLGSASSSSRIHRRRRSLGSNTSSQSSSKSKPILELRRLCEIAKDERGWERVRKWILSHSPVETKSAILQAGENGTSAIHMACKNLAPLDVVEMILNACEDALELSDDHGFCALHYACHHGANEEVLKVLILSCPKILTKKDSKGRNPLHFAVGNKFKATPIPPSVFTMLTQTGAARQMEAKGMLVSFVFVPCTICLLLQKLETKTQRSSTLIINELYSQYITHVPMVHQWK